MPGKACGWTPHRYRPGNGENFRKQNGADRHGAFVKLALRTISRSTEFLFWGSSLLSNISLWGRRTHLVSVSREGLKDFIFHLLASAFVASVAL